MLGGLKFSKIEVTEKSKGRKIQKEKKRKKEQKKRKKLKKDKKVKAKQAGSSSSSSWSEEAVLAHQPAPRRSLSPCCAPNLSAAPAQAVPSPAPDVEQDFFNCLGSELKRNHQKPDPDATKVHEREYNPHLRGEVSSQPAPVSISSIPRHLLVGDKGNSWRRRAEKRGRQAVDSEKAVDERVAPAPAERETPSRGRSSRHSLRSPSRSRSQDRRRQAGSADRLSLESAGQCTKPEQGAGDDVLRRMWTKYGGDEDIPACRMTQVSLSDVTTKDPNELGALAMQAMLEGNMERYEAINKLLESVQVDFIVNGRKLVHAEQGIRHGPHGEIIKVIEEVDAEGRDRSLLQSVQRTSVTTKGRKGKKHTANLARDEKGEKEGGFYGDDDVSLNGLIRREKIEGVQDYDSNFAAHILKNKKFKQLHEDDDEAYALGWYENSGKKTDSKVLEERQQRRKQNEKQQIQKNLEHCSRCMESRRFKAKEKEQVISVSERAYLAMDSIERSILPEQMVICPMEHLPAITDVDEAVNAEIRNYQKCLVRYFDAQDPPRAVLFGESVVHRVSKEKLLMGAGQHCCIVAYPIELSLLQDARLYFKKALDEAESEFETQHKKVIETEPKTGVRAKIPKHFPYVHLDFGLAGGYAHVVDNAEDFPPDFVQQTVAGMCELTVLDRAYGNREEHSRCLDGLKARFKPFDWAHALLPDR